MTDLLSSEQGPSPTLPMLSSGHAATTTSRSKLTTRMVSSFNVSRVHRHHTKPVTCLEFSQNGRFLTSCSPDDTIQVYDCLSGDRKGRINVQKYGAGVVRFVQSSSSAAVVTSSTKEDNKIRALDLVKQRYFRYFAGHGAGVVSISASPAGPEILSTSRDSYVMLWDARSEEAKGKVKASGTPIVAYDPKGLIFGVAYNVPNLKTIVKLYDARQYGDGPFLEFPIDNDSDAPPSCLKFSSDGEYFVLVNADVSATVSVYDAYQGALHRTFTGHRNARGVPLEASFSPDSAFISSGSDDGGIYMWDLKSREQLLSGGTFSHAMPSASAVWNPVYALFGSACQNVALWLPQEESDHEY